jgi:hypothetical protein
MGKLKNLKFAARLRQKTPLKPKQRNKTRWSSTYEMIQRFIAIKASLPNDEDIAALTPTPVETQHLIHLFNTVLTEIEAVTKYVQNDELSLFDVRVVFDELFALEPLHRVDFGRSHLRQDSPIVHSPHFESAIATLSSCSPNTADLLTNEQRSAVSALRVNGAEQRSYADAAGEITMITCRRPFCVWPRDADS